MIKNSSELTPEPAAAFKGVSPTGRWWKKPLVGIAVCLMFFAILELLCMVAGMPTLLEKEDPFKGFSGLVSAFGQEGDVYRTRRAVVGSTINDQSFLVEKPANGFRVFCLGGSSAYGFPLNATAAFGGMLQDVLVESHPELNVEFVNASGISYGIHRINIVADELLEYQPDVFIVYCGHNEFVEPEFFGKLKGKSVARTRLEYILAHSRVYAGINSLIARGRDAKKSTTHEYHALVRRDMSRYFSAAEKNVIVAEFKSRLDRLVRRAKASGVNVLLATVPCNLARWSPNRSTTGTTLGAVATETAWRAVRVGQNMLESGDADAAAAELEQAASLAPGHAEPHFLLGRAYEDLGQWDQAREAYRMACDMDAAPSRRVSAINDAIRDVGRKHNLLLVDMDAVFEENSENGLVGFELIEDYVHPTQNGHALIAWHMWDAMEKARWLRGGAVADRTLFDRVIAARKWRRSSLTSARWLYNQAVILAKQENREAAIEKFRQALEVHPTYTAALRGLGAMIFSMGQEDEALRCFERALEIDPQDHGTHNALANAYAAVGRADEAGPHYEEALRLKPDAGSAHKDYADMLARVGRLEEAVGHYQEALRFMNDDGLIHKNLGVVMLSLGRSQDAAVHARTAMNRSANLSDGAIAQLGDLLNQTGQHAEALPLLEGTVEIAPENAKAHKYLADALRAMGRAEEALTHYEEASRLMPEASSIHNTLGQMLESLGRVEEAVEQFEAALQLEPDSAFIHHNLGVALKRLERFEEAEDHERAALRLNPDFAEAYNGLGIALFRQEKLAEAVTKFEAALEIRPGYTNAGRNLTQVNAILAEQGVSGVQGP
jgi:tetratricopeptide (TPR) repeat protein